MSNLMNRPTPGFQYRVIQGDSLNNIEKAAYGFITGILESANPQIVGRVPSLENRPTIYAGNILTIPNDPILETLKTENAETQLSGKDKNEITIRIGEREIKYISARIVRTMDNLADTCSLKIQWIPRVDLELDSLLLPFTYPKAQVYIGNNLIINGALYGVAPNKSQNGTTVDLEIWSFAADLIDSTVTEPYEANNITLKDRAAQQLQHKGIKAVFDFDSGGAFDRVTAEMTDKIFQHLSVLASQRGLLITSTPDGNILFTKTTESAPVGTIRSDLSISLGWKSRYDGRLLYNKIRAIGESPGNSTKEAIAVDDNIPRSRFLTFRADETTDGNIEAAANWKRTKQYADALTIPLPVEGFYNPSDELWKENTKVTIIAPELFIPNGFDFLIRGVEYTSEESGKGTKISLVPPTVFTGEDLILPWEVS